MQNNALTSHESADIAIALKGIHRLSGRLDAVLLGDIPVLDEDGIDIIGHLYQDRNYDWSFVPVAPEAKPTLAPATPIRAKEPAA